MVFSSLIFLFFFLPAALFCYYIVPHKFIRVRNAVLLLFSLFFYFYGEPILIGILIFSILMNYLFGLSMRSTYRKPLLILCVIANLSLLGIFKYLNFFISTADSLFGLGIPVPDIVMPIGISFYTFQALGYTVDVYRGEIYAEKNFLKYALFVSFFPQLVAGPIERSKNLLIQINEKHRFEFARVRDGLLLMLYGYFQKVVLAEYLAIAVDNVYNTCAERTGYQLLIATVLFAFQIYCDFGSYSNIAIGAAKVMGFTLMENFNTPYFSMSVAEFWRRWHISLSTWFRDYLYIPLGGNRKGKVRKWFNLMIVFLVSGLWHGASWHYVFWGGLNGAYQVLGEWMRPVNKKLKQWFCVDETSFSHRLLRILLTFSLVSVSWIFFRAGSVSQGIDILKRILGFSGTYWFTWGDNLTVMGLTKQTRNVLIVCLGILAAADICKYRNIHLIAWITKQGIWFRWLIYFAAIFGILIFGVYGPGYDASQFIYFQF